MKESWQLSTSTISLTIDEVIDSIKNVQHLEVRLETEDTPTHSKLHDEKFRWLEQLLILALEITIMMMLIMVKMIMLIMLIMLIMQKLLHGEMK
jgi:hypothetical protein